MANTLWIAEKRSLAETVAKVLPGDAVQHRTHLQKGLHTFVWLNGHVLEQASPDHYLPDNVPLSASGRKLWRESDLPIVPRQWVLLPKENARERLAAIKNLLRSCDIVHHLGDPGAEGQLLVDEVLEYFANRKPVRRVLINDCNETKVRQALQDIRDNEEVQFRGWHRWALARSRYDWLLGLNCTRAMTLRGRTLGYGGLLPVGSVQTPLLHIMVERDRAIEAFQPVTYLRMDAELAHENGRIRAKWQPDEDQSGLDSEGRLTDQAIAKALTVRLSGQQGVITSYEQLRKEERPPLPLSLNELQIEAFRQYGYSGVEVMDAAQQLYQNYKVTTYPRSENRYLSTAAHAEASKVIKSILTLRPELASLRSRLDTNRRSAAFDDARLEGQDHHGIVPTVQESFVDTRTWSQIERDVHDLIVRSYLAQFAEPYQYLEASADIDLIGEKFRAVGRTPIAPGWKAVLDDTAMSEPNAQLDPVQAIPSMSPRDAVHCTRLDAKSQQTTPPPRFDDALMLIAMMDIHRFVLDPTARRRLKVGNASAGQDGVGIGIGTPATRSDIIADLKARQLVVPLRTGSRKLTTSPAARTLIDALPLEVRDPTQAGVFKLKLDLVASGALAPHAFLDETIGWITQVVELARNAPMKLPRPTEETRSARPSYRCPKCRQGMLRSIQGARGKFWGCMQYTAGCKATFPDQRGRPELPGKPRRSS